MSAWEIDFWGRIRRLSQAAQAQYLATDQARRGVTITLMSDVATAYFQLLDLDQELEIQRAATNAYAGSYRIFNDRLINGVASKLETDRAAAALANAAALIPQLEIQIATTENQFNVLLGRNPGPVPRSSLSDQSHAGAGDSGRTAQRLAAPPAGRAGSPNNCSSPPTPTSASALPISSRRSG